MRADPRVAPSSARSRSPATLPPRPSGDLWVGALDGTVVRRMNDGIEPAGEEGPAR